MSSIALERRFDSLLLALLIEICVGISLFISAGWAAGWPFGLTPEQVWPVGMACVAVVILITGALMLLAWHQATRRHV